MREVIVSATVPVPLSAAATSRLAAAVLRAERAQVALSVTFVGKRRMRSLNRKYLRHDKPTDVIAFPLQGAGDVYVCPEVAINNARHLGIRPTEEVQRLVIHGVLHVLGHDHPGADRTESPMWQRQERYLKRFGTR